MGRVRDMGCLEAFHTRAGDQVRYSDSTLPQEQERSSGQQPNQVQPSASQGAPVYRPMFLWLSGAGMKMGCVEAWMDGTSKRPRGDVSNCSRPVTTQWSPSEYLVKRCKQQDWLRPYLRPSSVCSKLFPSKRVKSFCLLRMRRSDGFFGE